MKAALLSLLPVLWLASCQVPSSISKSPSALPVDEIKISLPPLIVGLEGPTWGEVETAEVDPSGWSHPIDDSYSQVTTSRKVIAITFDDGPHPENLSLIHISEPTRPY